MAFTTNGILLAAVKSGDEISWETFYNMYKPLILLKGRDLHLTPDEREELVQNVMLSFFKSSGTFQYDRSKGRFRDYLRQVIHNKACDLMLRRHDHEVPEEKFRSDVLEVLAQSDRHWENEYQEHLLRQALQELRNTVSPLVFQAFSMLALENIPGRKVAETLDISTNAAYVYKHEALKKLKQLIAEAEE